MDGAFQNGYDGTTTAGYNITNSEMGHLFYAELGNKGYQSTDGIYQPGWGLTNTVPFTNLLPNWYWSGTEDANAPDYAWVFYPNDGNQAVFYKDSNPLLGLAVRPGQVEDIAPIPEPSTMLLLGGGLAGLAGCLLRRRGC